ncbi:MAG: hypothetical protein QW756_07365 [Nitrososphaerota archaeon]
MPPSRVLKIVMIAMPAASASLIIMTLLSFWQHQTIMHGMMGDFMTGMMPWMALPIISALAALAVFPLLFYLMVSEKRRDTPRIVGLSPMEQAVVDLLTERGGKATQKEIAATLTISRLKAHRLISSLKRRNVVKIQKMGRTNLVELNTEPRQRHSPEYAQPTPSGE